MTLWERDGHDSIRPAPQYIVRLHLPKLPEAYLCQGSIGYGVTGDPKLAHRFGFFRNADNAGVTWCLECGTRCQYTVAPVEVGEEEKNAREGNPTEEP
jgi:hypothetical protein